MCPKESSITVGINEGSNVLERDAVSGVFSNNRRASETSRTTDPTTQRRIP